MQPELARSDRVRALRRNWSAVAAGLVAAALAAVLLSQALHYAHSLGVVQGHGYVRSFDHPNQPLDIWLGKGDGQAFAQLARDPALRQPDAFVLGSPDAAYRAQRPLLGYLAWAASLGRPGRVPPVLAGFSVMAAGLAIGACAALMRRKPLAALIIFLSPGFLVAALWFTPEVLGLALGAGGLLAWRRDRTALAVTLFCLAGLARESMLLMPAALFLFEVSKRRARPLLLSPMAVWLAWVAFVHLRFGRPLLPLTEGGDLSTPFVGLIHGAVTWRDPLDTITFALIALCAVALVLRRPGGDVAWIAGAYAVLACFLGSEIWSHWYNFGRLLLPLTAFAAIAVIGARAEAQRGAEATYAALPM